MKDDTRLCDRGAVVRHAITDAAMSIGVTEVAFRVWEELAKVRLKAALSG